MNKHPSIKNLAINMATQQQSSDHHSQSLSSGCWSPAATAGNTQHARRKRTAMGNEQSTPQATPPPPPKKDESLVDVLFFPDERMPCKSFHNDGSCTRKNCKFSHHETSLLKLLRHLQQAQRSLDICVFTITCDEIAHEVINAHKRGVRVRVITDDEQRKSAGSDVGMLLDAGVPVRDDNADTHMHHKFCIIDGKILLNGSFNWSRSAVLGNSENVVISVGPVVDRFQEYYENLWKAYKPPKK